MNTTSFIRQSILLSLLFCFTCVAQAEVRLPATPAENAVTAEEVLGTNEDNLGLRPGSKIPEFTINSITGDAVTLSDLLKNAPVLVVFYRGGWCPYCNFQVRELAQHYPEFETRGVTPVLISADKPEASAMVKSGYDIPFPVLSDPDLNAHEAFDVVLEVDPGTYELYKNYGINLEEWSGKKHHKIALTSAFLIDKSGTVQWAHVSKDYKTRPSPEQFLKVIDNLK